MAGQSELREAVTELTGLLPKLSAMEPQLVRLGELLLQCWQNRGKLLTAGNGGSAADAMHLAEEFVVRFRRNRRALAAMALCDPSAITCAGNDFGYETIFSRQVEAFGNPGDVLAVFTTSGNSANILRAIEAARAQKLSTVAFLGKDGGKARGLCDIEFVIPSDNTARIQEGHKILYHALCEWVDRRVGPA
jgi:D-sedoheptulose 7-phosphate isomerase